jgi:hypothetical protein
MQSSRVAHDCRHNYEHRYPFDPRSIDGQNVTYVIPKKLNEQMGVWMNTNHRLKGIR